MVVTVFDRAAEFSAEGFYVFDCAKKILMCKYCNVRIEWQRKDTCIKHIKNSGAHKKNKEQMQSTSVTRQVSLTSVVSAAKKVKVDKDEFVMSTTRAFIEANIPLEKLDNPKLRQWMNHYIQGSGDLPSANRLCEHYVPQLIHEEEFRLKEAVKDQRVSILCDETTNRKGQCVFVVLVKVLGCGDCSVQKLYVGGVQILKNASATECSQAIVSVIQKLEIQYANITSITSDSARYMTKCISAIRILVSEELVHIQCWAHKLNLVGNVWIMVLSELNDCVLQTKHLFLNTRKRKHAYIQFLSSKYENETKKAKLFPVPVITRWNSWFKSVEYLEEYLHDIVEFAQTLDEDNAAICYFKALTSCQVHKIQCQAVILVEHCSRCCKMLLTLESSNIPQAHTLLSKLNDLSNSFILLKDGFFFDKSSMSLSQLPKQSQVQLTSLFKSVGERCLLKLKQLIDTDAGKDFICDIGQLFDPRNIVKNDLEKSDICSLMKKIPLLKELPASETIVPYCIFSEQVCTACKEGRDADVIVILLSLNTEYTCFVDVAVKLLWVPVNNVDSERSFSIYSNIMSDRRTNLTPENIEVMLSLAISD